MDPPLSSRWRQVRRPTEREKGDKQDGSPKLWKTWKRVPTFWTFIHYPYHINIDLYLLQPWLKQFWPISDLAGNNGTHPWRRNNARRVTSSPRSLICESRKIIVSKVTVWKNIIEVVIEVVSLGTIDIAYFLHTRITVTGMYSFNPWARYIVGGLISCYKWWSEVKLIMWEDEEDLKCTIKLTIYVSYMVHYRYYVYSDSGSI